MRKLPMRKGYQKIEFIFPGALNQVSAESEKMIIVNEQINGASTGPSHVIGMRKRISQVRKDSGQFRNNFKAT